MRHGIIPRVLITLVGVGLIFMGSSEIILACAGKSTSAVITSVRREGGERAEIVPGRYTYIIGYSFALPGGKKINGFTRRISDSVFMKADGTSTTQIRYLPAIPHINGIERYIEFGPGQVVLILAGGLLILFMNRRI